MAKDGTDSASCGAAADPCLTIKHALSLAGDMDTVYVHTGIYEEQEIHVGSGHRLLSADGPLTAKIYSSDASAVRFVENASHAEIDGFEIYGDLEGGIEDRDGLVRVHDASDIVIRNGIIHDAPRDADVIKVSGTVVNLLMDHLIVFNPSYRSSTAMYQEVIDIFGSGPRDGQGNPPVRNVVLRNSWLYQTPEQEGDYLIYAKIDVANVIYENNIFGPSYGSLGEGNLAVGVGTGEANLNESGGYVNRHAIVRNNVFVGNEGDAALGILNADDAWVYNNVFYQASGQYTRAVIELRGNAAPVGAVRIFNNVFEDNHPTKNGDGKFFRVREGGQPADLLLSHNLFFDNVAATDQPYVDEPDSVYQSPELTAPQIPATDNPSFAYLAEIRGWFATAGTSPVIDAGLDAVGMDGHPNWQPGISDWRSDIDGTERPTADSWDLGVHETP